ncbi:MAG: universal stress protein [Chloroflexi bacterium]|nr:universal stress protein [Chloroflexota bacterium]
MIQMQPTGLRAAPQQRPPERFRRIIVPLDGTPVAERVLPYVQYLASWSNADVTILHVLFRPQRPQAGNDTVVYPDTLHDRGHSLATAYLAEVARELTEAGLATRTVVVAGDTIKVITTHAAHGAFQLIAMGTNARPLLSRLWRESITERLTAESRVPLLIVNARLNRQKYEIPPKPRGLVIALDGSGTARRAIPYALSLAAAGSLSVTLLHVIKGKRRKQNERVTPDDHRDRNGATGRRLEILSRRFLDLGIPVQTMVRYGPPAETIVDVQHELKDHIVVLAARSRRGLRRTLLGGVVDRVVQYAADPVLVVPVRGWRQRDPFSIDGTSAAGGQR